MSGISFQGWLIIGLSVILILATIGFAVYIINRYPPESIYPPSPAESDVLLATIDGPVGDDDD